jgi:hypothetical protein
MFFLRSILRTSPLSLCLLLAVAGCREQNQPTPPANEVAHVGTVSISRGTFEELLNMRSLGASNRLATMPAKEALLDEIVRREAVFAKARAAGFDQRPDIQETVKRLIVSKFQEEQMKGQSALEPEVTDYEAEKFYKQHADSYLTGPKFHGAIVFLKISPLADPERRQLVTAKAQALLAEARTATPADFARLVEANSEDQTTRYRSGDMGWISGGPNALGYDRAVFEALSALEKPGDFAPLVSTKKGVYIVKLLESQPAGVRPLNEVKDRIVYTLRKQKLEQREQDFFATMKAGLDIHINRPLLESIHPSPSPPATLPATPGAVAQK